MKIYMHVYKTEKVHGIKRKKETNQMLQYKVQYWNVYWMKILDNYNKI